MKYLILLVFLAGCASTRTVKPDYNNTFWLGCVNAYLEFHKPHSAAVMSSADMYCREKKFSVDNASGVEK